MTVALLLSQPVHDLVEELLGRDVEVELLVVHPMDDELGRVGVGIVGEKGQVQLDRACQVEVEPGGERVVVVFRLEELIAAESVVY